jgi:alpha-N-acetylglucosaminidase
VAFPDVEPFVIQSQGLYISSGKQYSAIPPKNYEKGTSSDAYDHRHLWYNTSVAVHALELFL